MEEFQKSKGDRALDFALPALAVLEAIMTGKASKGNYIGHSGLDIMNARNQRMDSEAARREKAVERAARAEEATFNRNMKIADGVRDSKRAGMEEARYLANEDETHRKIVERDKAITRMLGIPTETDEATNTVSMGKPGLPDLTPIDREAIQQDPLGWISNRLKPAPTQLVLGGDGTYQPVNKLTGKNPEGKTVTAPPPKESKSLDQIAAEVIAKKNAEAEAERTQAGKTTIPGLTTIPGATITNDGVKKVQDIAVRKDELVNSIKRLQSLYDKHGTQLYGDKAREMESLVKGIQLTAKEFYNLGVLNGPDLGLMETIVANPTGLKENLIGMTPGAGDPVSPKLKEALSLVDGRYKSTIRRYGFQEEGSIAEGTERVNKQGVKMRMTGGKWQIAQ